MSAPLTPGQNRPVAAATPEVDAGGLAEGFGLAILPVGPDPAPAVRADGGPVPPFLRRLGPNRYAVDLAALGPGTQSVELVVHARRGHTLVEAPALAFAVDGSAIELPRDRVDRFGAAMFARLYRHGGGWKVRAVADGSYHGLDDLARLIGRPLDREPEAPPLGGPVPGPAPGAPQWTGSGFLVAPGLLATNAHVAKGAARMVVTGFDGRSAGEPILLDESCDLALLRVDRTLGDTVLPFRTGAGVGLGETAVALGYPLAGLVGAGPQVSDGRVSGLLGPGDDARVLQISAPIQPGSSGGPVLDLKGRLIGVATAGLAVGQNVNFAVRACLVQALVEAVGKSVALAPEGPDLDIATLTRQARGAVWKVEAHR